MALVEGRRGAQAAAQGVVREFRVGPTSAQAVHDAHAHFQEAVYGNRVFTATNPVAGTTVAAGGVVTNPLLALINPLGSPFNLVIWKAIFASVSGTVGAGAILYITGQAPTPLATATANAVQGNLVGGGEPSGVAKAYAAVTGALATGPSLLRPMAAFPAAPSVQGPYADLLDGEYVVPPGYGFAINPSAVGTTWVAIASIVFEEVPL